MPEKHGQVARSRAKAKRLNPFIQIEYESKSYTLEAETTLRRKFVLQEGEQRIGTLEPEHVFSRKATINLPEDIALPIID